MVMVETIDSEKLAKMLNKECEKIGRKMDVLIEVNTSGEKCTVDRHHHHHVQRNLAYLPLWRTFVN